MDPPATRRQSQPAPPPTAPGSGGFPSPTLDHARVNPKFVDDVTRMTYAVQQSLPESVRRIVRDNWEKCLLGSEFHQAFVVSVYLTSISPSWHYYNDQHLHFTTNRSFITSPVHHFTFRLFSFVCLVNVNEPTMLALSLSLQWVHIFGSVLYKPRLNQTNTLK